MRCHRAFREGGTAAMLMHMSGVYCYELKWESEAYGCKFEPEARLDADLLERVTLAVPPVKMNLTSRCEGA